MYYLQNDKLYQIISAAMPHPELLLGCKSLQVLENYINGYLDACDEIDPDCFTIQWYNAFLCYIAEVFRIRQEKFCICEVFRDNGYNDADSVDRFMELLEEFSQKKPKEEKQLDLADGEVRIFRVDVSSATDLIDAHLREHLVDYFGSSSADTFVYNWSKDQILTCAICSSRTDASSISPNNPQLAGELKKLPIFSATDRIRYTSLFLK